MPLRTCSVMAFVIIFCLHASLLLAPAHAFPKKDISVPSSVEDRCENLARKVLKIFYAGPRTMSFSYIVAQAFKLLPSASGHAKTSVLALGTGAAEEGVYLSYEFFARGYSHVRIDNLDIDAAKVARGEALFHTFTSTVPLPPTYSVQYVARDATLAENYGDLSPIYDLIVIRKPNILLDLKQGTSINLQMFRRAFEHMVPGSILLLSFYEQRERIVAIQWLEELVAMKDFEVLELRAGRNFEPDCIGLILRQLR
jgi:hypothetical protein